MISISASLSLSRPMILTGSQVHFAVVSALTSASLLQLGLLSVPADREFDQTVQLVTSARPSTSPSLSWQMIGNASVTNVALAPCWMSAQVSVGSSLISPL